MNDSIYRGMMMEIKQAVQDFCAGNTHPADTLPSIFTLLRESQNHSAALGENSGSFRKYDEKSNADLSAQYRRWKQNMQTIPESPEYAQAILELLEDCFSTVPSHEMGVSLYQSVRMKTAVSCARKIGADQGAQKDAPFALYTLDFSGIQDFIYTITTKGALKALRSRSLYLTILSEYTADLMLDACGLSRVNMIYSGGGKAHFLLSSAPAVIDQADKTVEKINGFLRQYFGTALYLASGWTAASEDSFTSDHGKTPSLAALFQGNSRQLSAKKLNRYTYHELMEMKKEWSGTEGRECAICGQSNRLQRWRDRDLCLTCRQLEQFTASLPEDYSLLCVAEGENENGLAMPSIDGGKESLVLGDPETAKTARHSYSINSREPKLPNTTRIFVSRCQARKESGKSKTFEDLAAASKGIRRLGVFRADVDNLGYLFASGFRQNDSRSDRPWQHCTLTHYAMLSSALTWFFQCHLDSLLTGGQDEACLQPLPCAAGVSVVYSGGDDVFLVGAWNDVLNAGLKLQKAFQAYTGGVVTLSAGFGLFTEHTPVPVIADYTAGLEAEAKRMEGKNALALFGQYGDGNQDNQCFHWTAFHEKILQEKVLLLEALFTQMSDKGNSFLYHVLTLFRQVQSDPMAISRLAYLLARHTPSQKSGASKEQIEAFQAFVKKAYAWTIQPEENKAFQTACLIYTYLNREAQKEKEA